MFCHVGKIAHRESLLKSFSLQSGPTYGLGLAFSKRFIQGRKYEEAGELKEKIIVANAFNNDKN